MNIKRLKSQGASMQAARIDTEAGILYDCVMCQEGEAKGHGVSLEASFIEDLVAFDLKHFSKQGVKARFGHPAMCGGDPIGTQAGVFKNFRTRQIEVSQGQGRKRKYVQQAIADLHLLESANSSPTHPGMKEYIMQMAAEQPDFIMNSIVFSAAGRYKYDKDGNKLTAPDDDFYDSAEDSEVFVQFGEHYYTDLVEAGAATDSLFSARFNTQSYAVQAVEWLNDNPSIKEFVTKNPDKVMEFLTTCGINISPKKSTSMLDNLKKALGIKTDDDMSTMLAEADKKIGELNQANAALTEDLSTSKKAIETATIDLATAKESLKTAEEENTTLKARVAELEKLNKGKHTDGREEEENDDNAQSKKSYHNDPITKQAAARAASRKS